MGSIKQHIDREIGIYMEREDISSTDMASKLDMTTNTLNAKRRGDSDWKWSELERMCDLFELTPDELTGWK